MLIAAIRALLDTGQEAGESLGRLVGLAGFRIARVQVQDRGAGLCGRNRFGRNLIRRDWEIRRHGRRVDRAGNCARDYYFISRSHRIGPPNSL
jgi:hypothetical protein